MTPAALRNALCSLFPLALVACGGAEGDPATKPIGDELGTCDRLTSIVKPATWLQPGNMDSAGCKQPPDHHICVSGVTIVAIDRYDETGDGQMGNYYVEDTSTDPKPYSGVTVFSPSFSPPDLRLAQEDVVDIDGSYTEFLGPSTGLFPECRTLPEASGTLIFRFDGKGGVPPIVVTQDELKTYATARPYMSMLVKLENVSLIEDGVPKGGRYTAKINVGGGIPLADNPTISNELYDIQGQGPELKATSTWKSVTGILTYFYGFHIAPRSPADFESE